MKKNASAARRGAAATDRAAVRDAIDASLSSVRFGEADERAVFRAVSGRGRRTREKRRTFAPQLGFALAALVLVAAPLYLSLFRAQDERIVAAAPGAGATATADATDAPAAGTPLPTPAAGEAEKSADVDAVEAVTRAARECFEAECDTAVFSFDEFAVSVSEGAREGGETLYSVTLESLYDNGCAFTALVAYPSLEIVQHSTPELATNPTFFAGAGKEDFYERFGPYPFTWDEQTQIEFSRRYEGGACRAPREGELTREQAKGAAEKAVREDARFAASFPEVYAYPMLYDRQVNGDSVPRYLVYCFAAPVEDGLSGPCALVTLRAADGRIESVEELSAEDLSAFSH